LESLFLEPQSIHPLPQKSPPSYISHCGPFSEARSGTDRNDITIFGGSFVKNAFGGAIQVFGAELTWQLHHRSGGNGTFGDMGEGSNANSAYVTAFENWARLEFSENVQKSESAT
jgi:hypothetical protein